MPEARRPFLSSLLGENRMLTSTLGEVTGFVIYDPVASIGARA